MLVKTAVTYFVLAEVLHDAGESNVSTLTDGDVVDGFREGGFGDARWVLHCRVKERG